MLNLFTIAATADATNNSLSSFTMLIPTIIIIVAFWFILIRPQRKKEKADAEMRKNVQIGDMIVSAGGIVGIVIKLEEQSVVIETSSDRSSLRLRRWAISENLTVKEENDAKAAAMKEAKNKAGIEK